MAKFTVTVYKTVQDSLRTFIDVDAADAEQATQRAREIVDNGDEGDAYPPFEFWQCGDSIDDYEYEANPA